MWHASRWCAVVLSLTIAGSAGARTAKKPPPKPQAVTTPTPDSEAVFEAEPHTGPAVNRDPEILNRDEMLSLVKKYASEITDALLDGERQRERAVRAKDSIKLSCIQDHLSNMKLMKKLSDDRLAATERPAIRADMLRLRHEFRGVELSHQRVLELHQELMACVGEDLEVTGGPASDIPTTLDPTGSHAEIPPMERPIPSSPYR
jgi:hypothetical protein